MNKTYRTVWHEAKQTWMAVAENVKAPGRGTSKVCSVIAGVVLAISASWAMAGSVDGGTATGSNGAVAVGNSSNASGIGAIAIGTKGSLADVATASGSDAIAIGNGSSATNQAATAVGASAAAQKVSATAVGSAATAAGFDSFAGGAYSFATDLGVALGYQASASAAQYTTAIGTQAAASGLSATAVGGNASATGYNGTALGGSSVANQTNATALGEAAQATASGATAVGQNASAQNAFATSVGNNAAAAGFGSYASGAYSSATNLGVAVGYQASASSGHFATAVGTVAKASNTNATALGGYASAVGESSTAVGGYASASEANATALGYMAQSSASGATAVGQGAVASAENSVALGNQSTTTADLATAGYNPGSTALSGIASTANGEVSVGSAGAERRVTNVAAGAAATDAVNVSQLQSEDAKVNGIGSSTAASLGGGSTYDPATGKVTQPTYTVGGTTYNNAGDAITNLAGQAADSVKYDDSTHDSITLGGAGSQTPVKLGNVAAGQLTATSTDAVNGSQLYATNQNVSNVSNTVSNMTSGGGIKYFHADSSLADSQASGTDAVAIGGNANASAANSVALGSNSVADRQNTVSVGAPGAERQITNVAAGTEGTDAVNLTQLKNAAGSAASALGGGSSVQADGTVTMPSYMIGGSTFNNVGAALTNLDGRVAQNADSITTINNTLNNVVSGGGIKYFHTDSTLADSQATGADAVAIGGNANASADSSVALGANSVADRADTVSVGSVGNERQITNVKAGTADTDAVNVAQLKATGLIDPSGNTNAAVVYDHNADGSTNYSSVTMGDGTSGPTTIHNVADGVAATDAVNVSQLNAAIGQVINTGVGSSPMFAAQGDRDTEGANASGTHSVASGANALASGTNAVAMGAGSAASGANTTALGANANASGQNAVALGAGSVADRDNTVSVGAAGSERQIANVAAGTQSTDAVNVGQLNSSLNQATSQANNYTDQRINQVQGSITDTSRKAYSGIAAATALTMIPDLQQGKNIAVGIGGAQYQGYGATAIGLNARVTQNLIVKAGVGISAAGNTYGIGGSYQW
ncbi:YadA-like family protein [Paraburkholderia fungorum]